MRNLFWLSEGCTRRVQRAAIAPFLPKNRPGARRVDDRRVISGIVHVLKSGCRWQDCPPAYGPPTTIDNRFHRWSAKGFGRRMPATLAQAGWVKERAGLDSGYVKAHRCAHGDRRRCLRWGRRRRRSAAAEAA